MENTGQSILLNLFAEPAQPVKSQSFSRSKDSDDNGEKFNDHLAALGEGEQFVNAEGAPPIGEDFDAFGNPVSVENIRGQNGFAFAIGRQSKPDCAEWRCNGAIGRYIAR